MYTFEKEIPMFGSCTLTDEEFEDIAVNADSDTVIPCTNCYALLKQSERDTMLIWGMDRFDIIRRVKDKNEKQYADIQLTGSGKEFRVPLSQFNARRLDSLSQHGLFCTDEETRKSKLSRYFISTISDMPTENADITVGFTPCGDDGYGFSGYDEDDKETFEVKNSFDSYDEYVQNLNQLIEPSVPLQFVVTAALASTTLAYMNIFYNAPVRSFIINLVGKSTTGKSTAQELAASMITSIHDKKVYSPFFGTENAVLKSLDGKCGICTLFDESTCVSSFNRETFIYSVSNEQEKKRMNSDCSERRSGTWKTIPIISSEEAFLEDAANRHQGLAIRLHKYHNLHYTVDREHAEAIHKFAAENYGIVGERYIRYLMNEAEYDFEELYNDICEDIRSEIQNPCNLTERLINQYAVIMLTCVLLEDIGVALDYEKIGDILLDHHESVAKSSDIAENAYETLMGYVSRNPYNAGIKTLPDKEEVAIVESLFAEILHKNGYRDIQTVVNELDAKGYTKRREKNRKKVKLSVNGNACYCYLLDTAKLSIAKPSVGDLIEDAVITCSVEDEEE